MNRWVVLGLLGVLAPVVPLACQGPDAFHRQLNGAAGGHTGGGLGGTFFVLGGATGMGGHGMGGAFGSGGSSGSGGFTASAGGRGMGGTTGSGGRTIDAGTTGGSTGTAGMSGGGGRIVDAGTGCVATLIANGYAAGTAIPCSMCTENGMSRATQCTAIIDCIAPKYPCTSCVLDCENMNSGSGPVNGCVSALMAAACGTN